MPTTTGVADNNTEISASTTLAAEGVYRFIVQAVVPAGAAGNAAYKVTVTATSVGDNAKTDTDSATATVGALYAVDLSDAPDQSTTAGATVTFRYTVTNTGNVADSFSLAAANVAGGDDGDFTSLKLFADADNDGEADSNAEISASTTLAAEGVYRFIVQAVVPAGAAGNAAYKVTVTATSVGDNAKTDTDSATATVGALYAVDLSDAPDQSTTAGATVTFRYAVTNNGNVADSFSLAAANVAGGDDGDFTSLKLFADADNDGEADSNAEISASTTLAAEGVYRFIVQAVVPAGAAGNAAYKVTVTATSVGDNAKTDTDSATGDGRGALRGGPLRCARPEHDGRRDGHLPLRRHQQRQRGRQFQPGGGQCGRRG